MNQKQNGTNGHQNIASTTARDLFAILFRQRRPAIYSFIAIFAGAVLYWLVLADRYQAETLILVDHGERSNPVVTPGSNAAPDTASAVTEEEMNSEIALLQSQDLLQQVVVTCGLDSRRSIWTKMFGDRLSKEQKVSKAVRRLAKKLDVEVVRRTNVISIAYPSSDPQLAAQVVSTLTDLYLKKHAAVHRPSGAVDFFRQQTEQYQKGLADSEAELVRFTQREGVVSAPLQTEAALQKLNEFEAMRGQTRAAIAETQDRIRTLESQLGVLPSRLTTQVKTSDSAQLLQQLKSTLLNLELKRTELLAKFEPTYRPVQEVETQITQTRAAIADADRAQWREETTDRDPAFELAREALTKARADLAGLQAREAALDQTAQSYGAKARVLQQQGVVQQNLIRKAKTAEENYLLYLRKHEEARISDALDTQQILNVAVAEAAAVPVLPVHSDLWGILVSALMAALASLGLAYVSDNLDPTLRTPDEVESTLKIPVLVAVPKKANSRIGVHVS